MKTTSETAFEEVVEQHLLANGFVSVAGTDFDRLACAPAVVAAQPGQRAGLRQRDRSDRPRRARPATPRNDLRVRAQARIVLVQLHDSMDPETGQCYTVKRYMSQKAQAGDSWQHTRITLRPTNPSYEPIVLIETDQTTLKVIAELLDVLP